MIFFVGAGPGDVDLITVKGRKLLEVADTVIYAGSLVSELHLNYVKEGAKCLNSAKMTLDEVLDVMVADEKEGKTIVRLHTGDPSIYGAIGEQMRELDKKNICYEVVPGVSSFVASNSVLKKEMTLPGVSQTVIITRMRGRTDVPEKEDLRLLSKHRASMAIFLSVGMIDKVVEELLEGYSLDTPCAVVYKATWSDEKVVQSTLRDIAKRVEEENIGKHAMILVGDFLDSDFQYSKLYDENFSTAFRQGKENHGEE